MQKITPELIPHEEFHTGRWLLPVARPGWYYFQQRKSNHVVQNRNFLQSVDKPLRKLVRWMQNRGIRTTPSCAGHVLSPLELEKVYAGLELDAADIVSSGLELKDIETGELILYKDPNYTLPWSQQQFLNEVSEYQKKGVLGFKPARHNPDLYRLLKQYFRKANAGEIEIREKDSFLFIFTHAHTYGRIRQAWKSVTRGIQHLLK